MSLIEAATYEDKDEILKLYKAQIGREFCPWTDEYPSIETMDFDLSRDSLFIMKDEGKIVAAVSIDKDEEVENLSCWSKSLVPGGELSRLAVLPEYQNKGIARQMLLHGMKTLKERGFKSIHFLVNRYNEKALRSYAVFGFNKVGECHMYEQDFFCYEKEL
ncbi:MAG: GNAT family N-acetyltransferase [Lachnospiraceae bacterium]|nr:GNAT family N-acetyltransferase [Lachnospiraceae bacterium]